MIKKLTKGVVVSVFALAIVACGNKDLPAITSDFGTYDSGICEPGTIAQGGACISLIGASPCKNPIHTGYDGDSQCLEAPSIEEGMHMHYGPANYDDPIEMSNFTINPGEELVDCMFTKTPNTSDIHMNNYHVRLRPGTHHMITYVQPGDIPNSVVPEACNQASSFTFLVGATAPNTDISATGQNSPIEYDGAAMLIKAKSQAAIQMHFINISDAARLKEGWINALYFPDDKVKMEINPITWIGGLGMNILPQTKVITPGGGASSCTIPAGQELNIITVVGHVHSHTERVAAFIDRNDGKGRHKFYEEYNWEDPSFIYYNSATTNSQPDPVTKTVGGDSGQLVAHPGDVMSWECEVNNDSDNLTLGFSDKALTGEMCNVFGVYGPGTKPWSCFSF